MLSDTDPLRPAEAGPTDREDSFASVVRRQKSTLIPRIVQKTISETQRSQPRFVVDQKQIVDFEQRPRSLTLFLRATPFPALRIKQPDPSDRALNPPIAPNKVGPAMREKPLALKREPRFQGKPRIVRQPFFVVFECGGFCASLCMRPKPTYPMRNAVKIHIHESLSVAHSD